MRRKFIALIMLFQVAIGQAAAADSVDTSNVFNLEVNLKDAKDSMYLQEFEYQFGNQKGIIGGYLINGNFYIGRSSLSLFKAIPQITYDHKKDVIFLTMNNNSKIVKKSDFICKENERECTTSSYYDGQEGGPGTLHLLLRQAFEKAGYIVWYDQANKKIKVFNPEDISKKHVLKVVKNAKDGEGLFRYFYDKSSGFFKGIQQDGDIFIQESELQKLPFIENVEGKRVKLTGLFTYILTTNGLSLNAIGTVGHPREVNTDSIRFILD